MAVGFFRALVVSSMVVLSCLSATAGEDPPPGDRPPPGEEPPRNGQSPPNLILWIKAHPQIAYGIKWQVCLGAVAGQYHVKEECRQPFWEWSPPEQDELVQAFNEAWNWYYGQPVPFDNLQEDFDYPFVNAYPQIWMDDTKPAVWIEAATARKLFLAWVAQNLVTEIGGHFPWSVLDYDKPSLQILFDSTAIMRMEDYEGTLFSLGSDYPEHFNYIHREDNLSHSLIAPPRYTYAFLVENGLIGSDKQDTIRRLLYWLKLNGSHYFGGDTYYNMEWHWQYRGIPPISRIIKGTSVGGPFEQFGFAHWTAGCHGTNGFLREVLRAVNIPVQIVRTCGHSQAHFITEGLYMDHGDDPYNWCFRNTCADPLKLLIDEGTFVDWFGSDPDNHEAGDGCENIGRRAKELGPAECLKGYIATCN